MNKEEIDKWLDNEYGVSYTRLEELHDFYFEKYCDLKQENEKLKKQLEESKDNYNCLLKQKEQFEYIMSKQVDYRGQQKEFILYLSHLSNWYSADGVKQGMVNEILQKYKETIGGNDENKIF